MSRPKQRNRIALTLILSAGFILLNFQNCAPNSNSSAHIGHMTEQPQVESPFAKDRVGISEASLVADESTDELFAEQGLPISIVVDNLCAKRECEGADAAQSIACHAFKSKLNPGLATTTQYYPTKLPYDMNRDEVRDWISANAVDRSCLTGISEENQYKIAAFNDPFYASQRPYLDAIRFQAGMDILNGDTTPIARVKVGIIDTGVALNDEIDANVSGRFDMRSAESARRTGCGAYSNEAPNHYHGTFVGGIIGAAQNNSAGIVGLAPNAVINSYAVGDCNGSMSTSEIANAVSRAVVDEMEVLNISLGGVAADDASMRNALSSATNKKVLVIVAAGNNNKNNDDIFFTPASLSPSYPGLVAVAATDNTGTLASYSNFGLNSVDIAAPGSGVISIQTSSPSLATPVAPGYSQDKGTSFAAPIVTSAAVLAMGYMKGLNYAVSGAYVKEFLKTSASTPRAFLDGKIAGSNFLDYQQMATSLQLLRTRAQSPEPITLTNPTWVQAGDDSYVDLTAGWNLSTIPPGARLGVFVATDTCNYSAGCLLMDIDLVSLNGSQTFHLPRNMLAPIMTGNSDPNFPLLISIAIYSENVVKTLPYVISGNSVFDLRSLDHSDANSALLGGVTDMRSDMQNFYVKGWACKKDSNQALTVSLRDSSGQTIDTIYGYTYPWMVPHSGVIDGYDPLSTWGDSKKEIFMADDIKMAFGSSGTHAAGQEGFPKVVTECRTLTGSHAFELIVPLWKIQSLQGRSFRVIASVDGREVILRDFDNRELFTFPEMFDPLAVTNSMTVSRASQHRIVSRLCSRAPSSVTAEISFSRRDFLRALYNDNIPAQKGGAGGVVHVPTVGAMKAQSPYRAGFGLTCVGASCSKTWSGDWLTEETSDATKLKAAPFNGSNFYDIQKSGQPHPANFMYSCDFGDPGLNEAASFNARWKAFSAKDGRALTLFCQKELVNPLGFSREGDLKSYYTITTGADKIDQLPSSPVNSAFSPVGYVNAGSWDWSDVGAQFSTSLVRYSANEGSEVGAFMKETYKVDGVLREMKKYETVLDIATTVLRVVPVESKINGCGAGVHEFNLSEDIDIQKYGPDTNVTTGGFFTGAPTRLSYELVSAALVKVPYTVRFFQDGKLIRHEHSDFANGWTEIKYPINASTH